MSEFEKKQLYLYVSGKKIAVSRKVYQCHWKHQRKERYFMIDLKNNRICHSTGRVIPSREQSLEELMQSNSIYLSIGSFEEELISKIYLEELCSCLTEEERQIVKCLVEKQMTHREIAAELHISLKKVNFKKKVIKITLKRLLTEN